MQTRIAMPGQEQATVTRREAMIAADAQVAHQRVVVRALVAASIAFVIGVVVLGSRAAVISRTPTDLFVRAASFSATVQLSDIDSVRLVSSLSRVRRKLNGFQFGSAYAGRFELWPHDSMHLFLNTSRPPYITVFAKTGVVILNGESIVATERLFGELSLRSRSTSDR